MPLPVKLEVGQPYKFSGQRIFRLSLMAHIPEASKIKSFLSGVPSVRLIQIARNYSPPINLLTPVFVEEPKMIPGPKEQAELYLKFLRTLRTEPIQEILQKLPPANLEIVLSRYRGLTFVDNNCGQLLKIQKALEAILRKVDPRFNFLEPHPAWQVFFPFAFDSLPKATEKDHDQLEQGILSTARVFQDALQMQVSLTDLAAGRYCDSGFNCGLVDLQSAVQQERNEWFPLGENLDKLKQFVAAHQEKYRLKDFHQGTSFVLRGDMSVEERDALLACFENPDIKNRIENLFRESQLRCSVLPVPDETGW